MEVILAKSAGFCFGVKRAVDTVNEELKSGEKIATYGPIIHNELVIEELERRGVRVIDEHEELPDLSDTTVIIRSHGVSRELSETLESRAKRCVDATCPFVKKIHRIVEKESREGSTVIIIGNPGHPEVEGIRGWSGPDTHVIDSEEEARSFEVTEGRKICIVSQTTFNYNKFQELVDIFLKKGYNVNVNVANTICNATEERQTEARRLASEVDAMIVIGGRHSSNSRKLYDICRKECDHTFFIQTLDDLELELPNSTLRVGITAGASTPSTIIEEVQKHVRIDF